MKKSFLVYHDQLELFAALGDAAAGQLIKAMITYSATGKQPELPEKLKMVFISIRQQINRDSEKYSEICQKNKENIQKRWLKDTTLYDRIRPDTKHTDIDIDKDTDKEIKTSGITNNKVLKTPNNAGNSLKEKSPLSPATQGLPSVDDMWDLANKLTAKKILMEQKGAQGGK